MSREKALVKNTFIFMIGNFASRFLGFFLLPLYTFNLSKTEYGYYQYVLPILSILLPIATIQINDAIYRYLLNSESEEESDRIITSSSLITCVGLAVFTAVFCIFASFRSFPHSGAILIYAILSVLSGMWQQIARGLQKNLDYAVSGVLFTAVTLASNVVLLLLFHMKEDALFYSSALAAVSVLIYIELKIHVLKRIRLRMKKLELTRKLMRYSIPLLPNSINWWVINSFSRYIIIQNYGIGANGIFAAANNFPTLLVALNSIFYMAWQESAIKEYKSEDKNEFYTNMFNIYMKFQFCMMLILLPVTFWGTLFIIGKEFSESWKYVPFLYAGTVFMSFSLFYGTGYLSSKDTKGAFTTSVTGAVINLCLNLVMIPMFGIQAASISNMVAFAAMWVFRGIQTRKYFNIRVDMRSLLILLLLTGIYIAFYFVNSTAVNVILFVLSFVIFYVFNRSLVMKSLDFIKSKLGRKQPLVAKKEGDMT